MIDAILWGAGVVFGVLLAALALLFLLYGVGALLDWWSEQTMRRQVRALEAKAAAFEAELDRDTEVVKARVLKAWEAKEDDRWSRSVGRAADRAIRESGSTPPKDAA